MPPPRSSMDMRAPSTQWPVHLSSNEQTALVTSSSQHPDYQTDHHNDSDGHDHQGNTTAADSFADDLYEYDEDADDLYEDDDDVDVAEDTTTAAPATNIRLTIYLVLSVVIALANSITWKKTLNRFRAVDGSSANLELFVTQWTIFLYVVLAATILIYRYAATKHITAEQLQYPQSRFVLMGLMDAVAGLCSSLGGAFTSGQVQTIINQANIPVTMILSYSFLHSHYTQMQLAGAALIVLGSLAAALPATTGGDAAVGDLIVSGTLWYGPLILIISTIPNSFSNVYKERNFKQDRLDVYLLTTFVSTYQVLLGFLFSPILSLPGLGGLRLDEIPQNLMDGWTCFTGQYVRGYDCHVAPYPYVILLVYVVVNFAYNVLLLLITKHGSALLLVIASAISLPCTNILFTIPLIMGNDCEPFSWYDVSGLTLVLVGFLMYSLVVDQENGDIMPVQGAAGQMIFVTDDMIKTPSQHGDSAYSNGHDGDTNGAYGYRRRSNSFDVSSSPLILNAVMERKRLAQAHYKRRRDGTGRSNSSSAVNDVTTSQQDFDNQQLHEVDDPLFFTPPP